MDDQFKTEEQFFAALIANGDDVSIFILTGIQLRGKVIGATDFCVFLRKSGAESTLANTSIIYKSAISSVCPLSSGESHRGTQRELHGVLSTNRRQ